MIKKLWKKRFIGILLTLILIISNTGLASAANGQGSFLYHRFGASITPTWEFMYVDGSTSDPISPETDDVPTLSRRFAASSSNTTLSQFQGTDDRWIVDVKWEWNYGIGSAFEDFETNKPISGENYYMTEAHVNRGWIWDAYYTNMPGTIATHLLNNAIYKDTHVESDIWTENPEQFAAHTEYHTQWMYTPDTGKTYENLSKDFGQAHGIYIYRWWNLIHQASRHGDPMDKLSWRDDLGTFGSNFTSGVSSFDANKNTTTERLPLLYDGKNYKIYRSNNENVLISNIKSPEELQNYREERLEILRKTELDKEIMATITFTGVDSKKFKPFIENGNVKLLQFGFSTEEGTGAVLNTEDKSFEEAVRLTEENFNIEIKDVNYAIVRGLAGELLKLSAENSVYLIDPAVYLNNNEVIETTIPEALHFKIKNL